MFPVPEPLRFAPGEPTAPPAGAPPTPNTVGEVAPERRKGREGSEVSFSAVFSECNGCSELLLWSHFG